MESWPLNVLTSRHNAWLEAMLEYVFVKRQAPSDVQEKTILKLENLDDFIDSELENISKGQSNRNQRIRAEECNVRDSRSHVRCYILCKFTFSYFNNSRLTTFVIENVLQTALYLKRVQALSSETRPCRSCFRKTEACTNTFRGLLNVSLDNPLPWLAGDVIGCCLDLDEGAVHFYRNGRYLGMAFDTVRVGPGLVYFPAVSLAFGENVVANFGATPLRHPVDGYRPLEKVNPREAERAWTLMRWVKRLLPVYEEVQKGAVPSQYLTDGLDVFRQGTKAQALLLAAPVLRRLGPLLASSHVTEVSVLPFLFQVLDENPEGGGILVLLELFWALLEPLEVQRCLQNVAVALLSGFRFSPCTPDLHHQKRHLSLFLSVVRHDSSRRYLLENVLYPLRSLTFDKIKFPLFMDVKPPDNETLATIVHDVWFELMEEVHPTEEAYKKSLYAASKQKLKSVAQELESLQLKILEQLTTDDDTPQGQTSRDTFLTKFEDFIKENSPGSRTVTLDLCPPSVALNFFHRLVALLRQCLPVLHAASGKLLQAHSLYIPGDVFLSDIGVRGEVSRVGDFPELPFEIASNQQSNRTDEGHKAAVELLSGAPNVFDKDRASTKVFRLLDGIVRLYYLCSHAHFLKMNAVREGMRDYLRAVQEVRRNSALGERDVVEALAKAEEVFSDTLSQQARQVAWLSAVVFSKDKQADVYWLLRVVLLTLEEASHSGAAFAFVPDYYVESCIKLLTSLSFYFPPTCSLSDIPGHYNVLVRYSTFLAQHFADPRVTNPDMKDALLRALAAHVCPPSTVRALECMPTERIMKYFKRPLQPEKNFFFKTDWIGHAYQETLSGRAKDEIPDHQKSITTAFFIFKEKTRNKERLRAIVVQVQFRTSQRRLIFLFNLTERAYWNNMAAKTNWNKINCTSVNLYTRNGTSTLVPVLHIAPQLCITPCPHFSKLFCREVHKTLKAASHICVDCAALRCAAPAHWLDARVAIATARRDARLKTYLRGLLFSRENALSVLLAEPSFQQSSLEFLLGGGSNGAAFSDTEHTAVPSPPLFSLANYSEVKEEEVEQVRQLVQLVQGRQPPATPLDEDQLCTICYAQGNSVRFVPCGHQSCQLCIMTHLVNNRECFFCKALIEKLDSQRPLPPH
ncbi:unnamed protein product [Ixodes hexagonus]